MAEKQSYRDLSRLDYNVDKATSHNEIQTGCLQRIADSFDYLEKERKAWAKQVKDLQADNTYLRNRNTRLYEENKHQQMQLAGSKGAYVKLKRANEKLKEEMLAMYEKYEKAGREGK